MCVDERDAYVGDYSASDDCVNPACIVGDESRVVLHVVQVSDDVYSHIQPVIKNLSERLTPKHRSQAIDLIQKNTDLFSRHEVDVGCTDLRMASIEMGKHPPIAKPLRI